MNKIANIIYGMIGALIVLLFWNIFTPNVKPIATVNLTGIVKSYVKEVAKANLQPAQSAAEVQQFASKLEANIRLLAKQKGVVIVPNEAVIAGARDLTPMLIKKLPAFNQSAQQFVSTKSINNFGSYQLGEGVKQ